MLLEVEDCFLEGADVIFEVADAEVAVVTQQTSDDVGGVAVVDMPGAPAAGGGRFADSAAAVLGAEHGIELFGGYPIEALSLGIRMLLRILGVTSLDLLAGAYFAGITQPIFVSRVPVELSQRLGLEAFGAGLGAHGGWVEGRRTPGHFQESP